MGTAFLVGEKNLHQDPPRVMVNSDYLGFECRVSQSYNLPTLELTRFVNLGVEFTNCFGIDAGNALNQLSVTSRGVFFSALSRR